MVSLSTYPHIRIYIPLYLYLYIVSQQIMVEEETATVFTPHSRLTSFSIQITSVAECRAIKGGSNTL